MISIEVSPDIENQFAEIVCNSYGKPLPLNSVLVNTLLNLEKKMIMELTIELTEFQFKKLQEKAKHLGILPKQLIKKAVNDLLDAQEKDFLSATDYVLDKNKELYRRLS